MPPALRLLAAALHFSVLVFLAGFLMGAVREIYGVGLLGPVPARLVELPFMLAIAFVLAGIAVRVWRVPAQRGQRLIMGLLAFVMLMAAEFALGLYGFGMSFTGMLQDMRTWPGFLALLAQGLVAIMPLCVARHRSPDHV